nr:hypothetical protein [Marinicella sp. W31]MDC2878476.1 hypothetical protein [Marinicella sp. W31]
MNSGRVGRVRGMGGMSIFGGVMLSVSRIGGIFTTKSLSVGILDLLPRDSP